MRLVLQRVTEASVTVDGAVVGSIGAGLMVLCGISEEDDEAAAEWACRKLLGIRLWEANGKPWAASVTQAKLGVLLVSQFTLHAQLKGNKPDFHRAMKPELSKPFWERFVQRVTQAHKNLPVQTGVFGAKMDVSLINDGPVTIELDSAAETSKATAPPPPSPSPPPAPPAPKAAPSTGAPPPGAIGVLLHAPGAFAALRLLEARGMRPIALKSVRAGATGELAVAAALSAPSGGTDGAVQAAAQVLTMLGPGARVLERWDDVLSSGVPTLPGGRQPKTDALISAGYVGLFEPHEVLAAGT